MLSSLLKLADVAKWLGVSKQYVAALVRSGDIPVIQLGPKTMRFRPEDLEKWLEKLSGADLEELEDA